MDVHDTRALTLRTIQYSEGEIPADYEPDNSEEHPENQYDEGLEKMLEDGKSVERDQQEAMADADDDGLPDPDADGDGWGSDEAPSILSCFLPPGYAWEAGDCDDADPARSPEAVESCQSGDEDCDGLEDEEDPSLDLSTASSWWVDEDGDGWGQGAVLQRCSAEEGEVPAGPVGDCDDSDASSGACWDLEAGWSLSSSEAGADLGLSMAWVGQESGAPSLWLGAPGEE